MHSLRERKKSSDWACFVWANQLIYHQYHAAIHSVMPHAPMIVANRNWTLLLIMAIIYKNVIFFFFPFKWTYVILEKSFEFMYFYLSIWLHIFTFWFIHQQPFIVIHFQSFIVFHNWYFVINILTPINRNCFPSHVNVLIERSFSFAKILLFLYSSSFNQFNCWMSRK